MSDLGPDGRMLAVACCFACLPETVAAAATRVQTAISRPDIRLDVSAIRTGDGVYSVELSGEARNKAELGFGSMRAQVQIDCARRRDRVQTMVVFPLGGHRGEARTVKVHGEWTEPSPDAYLADVISRLCSARRAQQRPVASPRLPVKAVGAERATPLPPSMTGRLAAHRDRLRSDRRTTSFAVQLTAAGSEVSAWRLLNDVKSSAPPGTRPTVTPARVHGRLYYRGVLQGFSSRAQAVEFCATRRAAGADCLVRSAPVHGG